MLVEWTTQSNMASVRNRLTSKAEPQPGSRAHETATVVKNSKQILTEAAHGCWLPRSVRPCDNSATHKSSKANLSAPLIRWWTGHTGPDSKNLSATPAVSEALPETSDLEANNPMATLCPVTTQLRW